MYFLPNIDPVAISLGPLKIHWYALSYIVSILISWGYVRQIIRNQDTPIMTVKQLSDFITWLMMGVLVGGRLGYVIFYELSRYLADPWKILMTWQGGMSFHGGLLGVIIATVLFCRIQKVNIFTLSDFLAITAPLGLFLGRLANFVNGELYGRITDVSWSVIFPKGGMVPRHPSQLYEAILEGFIPLIILNYLYWKTPIAKKPGQLAGLFLVFYAGARIFVECVRQPDEGLGFFFEFITMGQILTIPMFCVSIWLLMRRS